jgi:hypothetical protein
MMDEAPRRWSPPLLVVGAVAVLLAGGLTWIWSNREPIGRSYIDRTLKAYGVPASYRLARVGFPSERIEAVRIGDPAHPDLTADWAEIELSLGLSGVRVRTIDARGVRLHGRLVDGRIFLGTIDRLLPRGGRKQRLALPDIDLAARSMRLDLATPQGLVHAVLDGRGNLHDNFRGTLGLASDRLAAGGCGLAAPRARLAIATDAGLPSLRGPVEAARIVCAAAGLEAPRLDIDAQGDADLARWRGDVTIARGRLSAKALDIGRLGGGVRFDASAENLSGRVSLRADGLRYSGASIGRTAIQGRYRYDPRLRSLAVQGDAKFDRAQLDPAAGDRLVRQLAAADGTPIGPILAAWGSALRQASRQVDATAAFSLDNGPKGGAARIERFDADAAGGGHLSIRSEQAEGLGWRWPGAGPLINASAELSGGNLPGMLVSLRQPAPGAPLAGSATIAPYQAGRARLHLSPLHIGPDGRGGTAFSTRALLDGPVADGEIGGLDLPITAVVSAGGAIAVNPACTPVGFARLAIAGAVIARSRLTLCPLDGALFARSASGRLGGGARVASPRLRGRVGEAPLTLGARSLTVSIGRPGFRLDEFAVRLGDPATSTRLDVTALDGTVGTKGLSGHFEGADGKIGAVPLLISNAAGQWQLASSVLTFDGGLTVADAEADAPRFRPLVARDVQLTLKAGRIAATGTLREPRSSAVVAHVSIRHDLSSGGGDALLDVDNLRFGKALQPEAITPLTLGMVANLEGALSGQGRIRWSGGNVTSDGEFHSDGLNLAAAFGPVAGLKGMIRFTDLLGLVTAPDQRVTIAEINPGVAVTDGVIRYRILPGHKLAIADGQWPFSGGTLMLEPSLLDMAQPVARRLSFRIAGLDAATFVQELEFKNLAVTGKFDGALPIVFDARGGRIENGHLTVGPEGGTLSYVGDVTNANLGRVGNIAFDALKSIRYKHLTIELNGDLDGEIISRVRFDGANNKPKESTRSGGLVGHVLAPITRLPFRFNIVITAPFRGLVNSAQTFIDPSIVLHATPAGAAPAPAETPPVQPR